MARKTVAKKGVAGNELEAARESRLAAIQMLIPLGLKAVAEELAAEVESLAGPRYSRGGTMDRHGRNGGSVYLGDRKVRVQVPRVRRKDTNEEVPLASYHRLQAPRVIEQTTLNRVIRGVSMGDYAEAALATTEAFGITRSAVSRRWIRASSRKLKALRTRSLKKLDIVAVVLDGKTFGENEIILAVGVTMKGEKVILGFVEAGTESFEACRGFLNGLMERGLSLKNEVLVVIDGGKGLRKAVGAVFGEKAFVQRCQWHKRENVVGYLGKERQAEWRGKLQAAYETPTYWQARNRLMALRRELKGINQSAVKSLDEGLEETLTLHRLKMFEELGISFKTTNLVENVNGLLERYTGRVSRWRNSDQRQRWAATALLEIEDRLNKVRGHKHLASLRLAMSQAVQEQRQPAELQEAA
jgi:transposase-like protein